jgi:hypothetical protein
VSSAFLGAHPVLAPTRGRRPRPFHRI